MEASWFAREYFEGALADAPASARSAISMAAETRTSAPVMVARHLNIASSMDPRQRKQGRRRRFRDVFPKSHRHPVIPPPMMISRAGERKNKRQMLKRSACQTTRKELVSCNFTRIRPRSDDNCASGCCRRDVPSYGRFPPLTDHAHFGPPVLAGSDGRTWPQGS